MSKQWRGCCRQKSISTTRTRYICNHCWTSQNGSYNTQAGYTPFYLASLKGHIAIVRLLIGKKANVNMCDKVLLFICGKIYGYWIYYWFNEQSGFSPVYAASQEGHTVTVDLLLEAGAMIHLASTEVSPI